ncbi:hypothetical protein O9993_01430 [Vibrio lentus]|nr:hypothetical protein [Vibrio lentus]
MDVSLFLHFEMDLVYQDRELHYTFGLPTQDLQPSEISHTSSNTSLFSQRPRL